MSESEEQLSAITLEKQIATLENASHAVVFSTGLTACYAITKLLRAGDHVVISEDVYGGAYYLLNCVLSQHKVKFTYVDTSNIKEVEKAIYRRTRLIWLENPSNPLLRLADIQAISNLANKKEILIVVDNSLLTGFFQKPLGLGADIVLYSSVKNLSGRTDIVGGAIATNRADLSEKLQEQRNSIADWAEAIDCFSILKGLRSLSKRLPEKERSAKKIAEFLNQHPLVQSVYYPGLPTHPQHQLACKQMTGFGNMLAFDLKGGTDMACEFVRQTEKFVLYENTGNADSLLASHSIIAHAKLPAPVLEKSNGNMAKGVIRITVGLENVDELINDLNAALRAVSHQLIEFPANPDLRKCI